MSRSVKDVKIKILNDIQTRSKSRKNWQKAKKSVKLVSDVVASLRQIVKSRQRVKSRQKSRIMLEPRQPKKEAIIDTGWRTRETKMPPVVRLPSVMGTIDEDIMHMFLPLDLIPQASYDTLTSQLTNAEQLDGMDFMLDSAGIITRWYPSIKEMFDKQLKEPTYISRSTGFTVEQLRGIMKYIKIWINRPSISGNKILVLDFMNLYFFVKKDLGITDDEKIYNIIEFMLKNLMNSDGYTRIIICVQNHQIKETGFKQLLRRLDQFLGSQNSVLVLPAINKTTMDDFFVVLCSELLEGTKQADHAGFFVNDNYKDFTTKVWHKISITTIYTELERSVLDFIARSTLEQKYMLDRIVYDWSMPYDRPYDPYGKGPVSSSRWGPVSSSRRGHVSSSRRGHVSSSRHWGGQGTIKHKKSRKVYKKTYKKHKTIKRNIRL